MTPSIYFLVACFRLSIICNLDLVLALPILIIFGGSMVSPSLDLFFDAFLQIDLDLTD